MSSEVDSHVTVDVSKFSLGVVQRLHRAVLRVMEFGQADIDKVDAVDHKTLQSTFRTYLSSQMNGSTVDMGLTDRSVGITAGRLGTTALMSVAQLGRTGQIGLERTKLEEKTLKLGEDVELTTRGIWSAWARSFHDTFVDLVKTDKDLQALRESHATSGGASTSRGGKQTAPSD